MKGSIFLKQIHVFHMGKSSKKVKVKIGKIPKTRKLDDNPNKIL